MESQVTLQWLYKWYIRGIFPANWGIICYHLLGEPKTTIENMTFPFFLKKFQVEKSIPSCGTQRQFILKCLDDEKCSSW